MFVTVVHVKVKPDYINDFIQATEANHRASVDEPGNRRFDVLQSKDDPSQFVLYEAYSDPQAAADHKKTSHYQIWRETVEGWMAEPRKGIQYNGLFPKG